MRSIRVTKKRLFRREKERKSTRSHKKEIRQLKSTEKQRGNRVN
jgi:hypothetical protein